MTAKTFFSLESSKIELDVEAGPKCAVKYFLNNHFEFKNRNPTEMVLYGRVNSRISKMTEK